MKLLLASAGFYTPEIADKCVELVGKRRDDIAIAVINEAYAAEHGDHGWVLDDLNRIKQYFPGRMELVNLLAFDLAAARARLELADVIFVVGGHTDYLMSVFKKTGFDTLLSELLATKVYVGSSAGSMVVGRRISTAEYAALYGQANDFGTTEYMGLVDFAIKPHLGNPLFPDNNPDALRRVARGYQGTVYGLSDNAAIVVDGDKTYHIGTPPVTIINQRAGQ